MRRIRRFLTLILSVVAAASLLLCSLGAVVAAPPTPSNPLIKGFVLETDNLYGYEILRPASWTSTDLGDRRGYQPGDSAGQPNRIALTVTNLKTVSDSLAGKNALIANYQLFLEDPSLSGWMDKTERLWQKLGIQYNLVHELTNARIYAVTPSPGQLQLVAYAVSHGQPLAVAMYGFGTFSDIQQLKSTGLLADLQTMVNSASPRQGGLAPTALKPTASELIGVPLDLGPYHNDSGYRSVEGLTYRLQTDYYQAPPRLYWLYEYMYYPYYSTHNMWLYRTDVTDYPQITCVYGDNTIYQHPINKMTTYTNGTLVDSFYPNVVVSHLSSTTVHMEVFGDPFEVYCQWYNPFTH